MRKGEGMKPINDDENLPIVRDEIRAGTRRKFHGVIRVSLQLEWVVSCVEEKSLSLPSFNFLNEGAQNGEPSQN